MKQKTVRFLFNILIGCCALQTALAQTSFTYQGKLVDDCCPATGLYDMKFRVYDTLNPTINQAIVPNSLEVSWSAVPVTNGMFTVMLNFDAPGTTVSKVFTGPRRWLAMDVRTNNATPAASYVTLSPRTELTPAPCAIFASTAGTVANNAITAPSIAPSQVVKSLNGLKDDVTLTAGANVTLTPNGNSIQISSTGGNGLWANAGSGSIYYSGGNVGIGTANPSSALSINSPSSTYITVDKPSVSYESGLTFRTAGATKWYMFTDNGTDDFKIETSGMGETDAAPRIQLPFANKNILLGLSGGNVGIGVSNPGQTLDVGGRIRLRDGGGLSAGTWLQTAHGFGAGGVADIAFMGVVDATRIGFWGNDPRGALGWGFTFDTVTGNVGIGTGTSYPLHKLEVRGDVAVCTLTITGGCDLSEPFNLSHTNIAPGSVVVIDEANPGKLRLSDHAFDTRVAGIVSGANGVNPGISMHQEGKIEDGQNIALSGRVYAQADATETPIQPGDLLTTSFTPGHCMKATDSAKAQGAIIGKAMTALDSGKGMVLVLVSLQ